MPPTNAAPSERRSPYRVNGRSQSHHAARSWRNDLNLAGQASERRQSEKCGLAQAAPGPEKDDRNEPRGSVRFIKGTSLAVGTLSSAQGYKPSHAVLS